jgi:serine/threonine-protein kinase
VAGLREIPELVHRDLKPANVLWHEGRWKIADFGIAKFHEDATSLDTLRECLIPAFAAPEQWNLEHPTRATDVYALGCIAHVLLRGEPPFLGPSSADYRQQHLSDTAAALDMLEARPRAIVSAMLRKVSTGRPALERVEQVFRDAAENPGSSEARLADLRAADALEAERVSAAAAKAAQVQREQAERARLVQGGLEILSGILDRMEQVARDNTTDAKITRDPGRLIVKMGEHAFLKLVPDGAVPSGVKFGYSGWEPVAIARLSVRQSERGDGVPRVHEWEHGATLWYMRLPGEREFRWYEVAYKPHGLMAAPPTGPFPIQEAGNDMYVQADLAAGPGMHTVAIESGPTPIDDEAVDVFVERWLTRLAQAYAGRLRPF